METILRWLIDLIELNTTCDTGNPLAALSYIKAALSGESAAAAAPAPCGKSAAAPASCGENPAAAAPLCGKSPVTIELLTQFPAPMLYAKLAGTSKETILLHAHIDTAPYEEGCCDDAHWRVKADAATRIKGNIFGRGALDCKSQAAVWMKIFADACGKAAATGGKLPERSLALLITSDEETGGHGGLALLTQNYLQDVVLVCGEGGGFPFPCGEKLYYTFQTGEIEADEADGASGADRAERTDAADQADGASRTNVADQADCAARADNADQAGDADRADAHMSAADMMNGVMSLPEMGVLGSLGYCNLAKLEYYCTHSAMESRRLDVAGMLTGSSAFLKTAAPSTVYADYGSVFERALQEALPQAELMPVITPGFSDNRHFRHLGIPTIGFFPFDRGNHILMHVPNEYISEKSLQLAYRVVGTIIEKLIWNSQV